MRRSDDALTGCEGKVKLVDDILIWASSWEELKERVIAILRKCAEYNITISKKKVELGRKVSFAGFDVSKAGITPSKERIKAIMDILATSMKTMTGIRRFQGATQFLTDFVPDLQMKNVNIRELLKKRNALVWDESQHRCFEEVKKILTGPLIMGYYDPELETELITDASRIGVGFVLRQFEAEKKRWKLIQCGSRALSETESRYSVCEIEGLGVLFAIQKSSFYLKLAPKFKVLTDHKSLKGVRQKDLIQITNVRLRRFFEKIQEYDYEIEHIKGTKNQIADMLSRHPTSPPNEEEEEEECVCRAIMLQRNPSIKESDAVEHMAICRAVSAPNENTDPLLQKLIDAAKDDLEYQDLIERLKKFMYLNEMEKDDYIRKAYGAK